MRDSPLVDRPPPTREPSCAGDMLQNLKRAGLKLTAQRIAIVRHFAVDRSHPTAQDLFERLRPGFPSMSFATVYNTLNALASAGLAGTLRLGNAARFDPNTKAHHHAICERCGAVCDVAAASLDPNRATIRKLGRVAPGFAVRAVERVYRGVCARCSAPSSSSTGRPIFSNRVRSGVDETSNQGD